MPRETVRRDQPRSEHDPGFEIWVGWSRDHEVQIATTTGSRDGDGNAPSTLLNAFYGDWDTRVRLGSAVREMMPSREFANDEEMVAYHLELGDKVLAAMEAIRPTAPHGDGLWVTLSRKRINDLIRLLRRARKSAYGEDA